MATGAAIEIDGSGLSIAEPITSLIGTGIGGAGALRNLANDNTWSGASPWAPAARPSTATAARSRSRAASPAQPRPLTVGGAGNTIIGGVIATTTGTLTKDGAGSPDPVGASTPTPAPRPSTPARCKLGIANAIGASSALTVSAGATFDLAGFSDTIGSLAGAGT